MTEPEVQKLVCVLIAAFPSAMAKVDDEHQRNTMAIYRRMLADLDYLVANAAVERLLATCRFMPAVSEIRDACLSLTQGEVRAGGDAWGSVLKAIAEQGAHRTPGADFQFRDPVVLLCVKALGWRELCLSENQVADRARFIELYEQLAAKQRRLALSEGLPAMQRLRAAQAAKSLEGRRPELAESKVSNMGQLVKLVLDRQVES